MLFIVYLQLKLGHYFQTVGYISYYDRGPPYGLIFGLVFGVSIPLIILGAIILYILCVWRKKQKRKITRPIVSITPRSRIENSAVGNSYHNSETIPLQTRNNTNNSLPVEDDDFAKGE